MGARALRVQLWNKLTDVRFRADYSRAYSIFVRCCGGVYSFILSFASAGSIAAWAFWGRHPALWAIIIGIAQVLHVAKPHIGILKSEAEVLAMSFEFEQLYLAYERLWTDFERKTIDHEAARENFYELRQREVDIERMYRSLTVLNLQFLVRAALEDTLSALRCNFNIKVENE
jgi:hypothetical protein